MEKSLHSFDFSRASGLGHQPDLKGAGLLEPVDCGREKSIRNLLKVTLLLLAFVPALHLSAQCPTSTAGLTPTAKNDSVSACFGTALTIPYSQLLANDAGPGGKAVSLVAFSQPTSGTITQSGTTLIYTPAAGFSGKVTFTYTIKQNDGIFYFNGHYYQISASQDTWDRAAKNADKLIYNGRKGYLVTITSAEENDFIKSAVRGDVWIGASDIDKEGTWKWETGPEGTATAGGTVATFTSWLSGQPDNGWIDPTITPTNASRTGQHYASSFNGLWSDFEMNNSKSYIIEYGGLETGCLPVVNATATVTITVSAPINLSASPSSTCTNGSTGSVSLSPSGGKLPYSYDYLKYSFTGSALDANTFDFTNGNFLVNGDLKGSAVANTSTGYDNSVTTKALYPGNNFIRCEGSFKTSPDASVLFGITSGIPHTNGAMLIRFGLNKGAMSYTLNGNTYSCGSYVADTWYDLKIEKNGTTVNFYTRKTGEAAWDLVGSVPYYSAIYSFKVAAQYFDDNTSTPTFNTKDWTISYNPPLTGLAAGDYVYTVTDASGCTALAAVSIDAVSPVTTAVANPTSAVGVCDGSLAISSSSPVAHISNNVLSQDFSSNIDSSVFTILNGNFSSAGNLRAEPAATGRGWANSITSKAVFADKGFLRYQGSYMFDDSANVSFGFSAANITISNLGDEVISFNYNNGNLSYFINGKYTAVGTFVSNTWYDFKIEKTGTDVRFYTRADGGNWILKGREIYAGSDASFKAGAQYNGSTSSNGGFNTTTWKVDVNGDSNGLCAGDYTYEVTSTSGCTSNVSFSVYEPLTVTATATDAKCYGTATGKMIVTAKGGKGPYTYSIDNGATYVTTNIFDTLGAGSYQIIVKDARGIVSPITQQVIGQPAQVAVNITASGALTFCSGGSVSLAASKATTYLWNNGATTSTINVAQGGDYTVKVTDSAGCSGTSAITKVIVNPLPVAAVTPNGNVQICQGSSLDLNASGGTSYKWNTTATTSRLTVNAAGNYSVTVTDANGCSATSAAVTVKVSPLPTAGISAGGPTTFCAGSSVNLTGTGGASYLWNTGATTSTLQATASGSYSVKVTDANGCSANSAPLTVTANPAPAATITPSGSTLLCQGSSVNLVASGGGTYLWSNGATTSSIATSSSGTFTVKVTGTNGCSATSAPVVVSVNPVPLVSITANSSSYLCKGVVLTATSSSSIKSYAWSDGSTTQSINLTSAKADGTYSVNITDNNGCKNTTAASYAFNKQNLIEAYSIVGLTSVNLGTSTVVSTGSVGVTGSAGTITLGKSVSVASTGAFVKAKTINVTTPVNAPTQVKAAVTVTLPVMQTNTTGTASSYTTATISTSTTSASNYKSLTIKAGTNVTLSGSIFGTITIQQGATVTFTNTTVNIDQLIAGTSKATATSALTTLHFAANSSVRISTSVNIYGRSRVNAEENKVTFYCGDSSPDAEVFNVNGLDIVVGGTVYIPVGTLTVSSTDATTTSYMKGLFIADKITSTGAKVVWQSATCLAGARVSGEAIVSDRPALDPALKVSVRPNPSSTEFTLVISSASHAPVSIRIVDVTGRIVESRSGVSPSTPLTVGRNLTSGNYYAQVVQEGQFITTKLIKAK